MIFYTVSMIFLSDHMVKDKSHDMIRLSDAMDPEQGVLPIRTGKAPGLDKDTKGRPRKQDVSGAWTGSVHDQRLLN